MATVDWEPAWKFGGERVEPAMLPLLASIQATGSLAAAAREARISYRHAWNLLGKWNTLLGTPLVQLQRGRGARLTAVGEKIVAMDRRARERLGSDLAEMAGDLEGDLSAAKAGKGIIIHASHDIALAKLPELAARSGVQLRIEFGASVESLDALARGACDLAGFHVAEQSRTPQILRRLKPQAHKLIGVSVREQGLIVARGNPRRIQGLHDLARSGMRLVNRQRGSGTRLVLDQLLAGAGIERSRIPGYEVEELTHLAVAAAVAGGLADVGFGIRAAAAQWQLGFIPLVNERYFLACPAQRIATPPVNALIALMQEEAFRKVLARLPGYSDAITGRIMDVEEGLAGPRPARMVR